MAAQMILISLTAVSGLLASLYALFRSEWLNKEIKIKVRVKW